MSRRIDQATWLYIINAGLLATHEIDSAYWHEWSLFHLPGDIGLFLILNLALLLLVLVGLRQVVLWQRGAKAFSFFLAASGIFAFKIHLYFILVDNPEFRAPVSLVILSATLVTSLVQAVVVFLCPKPAAAPSLKTGEQ